MANPVPVIFDSDMDTDCDDAGALAVIHALAQEGRAQLLAGVCNAPSPWGADCIRAINAWYRHPVPVGSTLTRHPLTEARYADYRDHLVMIRGSAMTLYNERVARSADGCGPAPSTYVDAVQVYRQVLAEAQEPVVIIAVGMLTALADLLESPPDAISPLPGQDLISRKVGLLLSMGSGSFPHGYDGFNWRMDRGAAITVLNRWPALLIVNELGSSIETGAGLQRCPPRHPVRIAYETFLGGAGRSRSSWDQVTALHAITGGGAFTHEVGGHTLAYLDTGEHRWSPAAGGPPRRFLRQSVSDSVLAAEIERLMLLA